VATSVRAEGLNYANGENIVIADSAADIAAAIIALLNDRERAARIGAAGHRLVEREYTWDATAEVVQQEIARAINRGPIEA
jgi:glycosyltransferase involved in cell wall biosynthesis